MFSFLAGIAVLRDEFAVPAEYCVWRENGRQFQQSLAANRVGFHREQPTLIVIQQKSLLAEFLQERLDLSILELDDLLLSLIYHAANRSEQDVPGLEQERHVRRRN